MIKNTEQSVVDEIYDILEIVAHVFTDNSIEYSIASGTLLGACRHSGFIPWDDDADLFVLNSQLDSIKELSGVFLSHGLFFSDSWYGLRLCFVCDKSSSPLSDYPFVDLIPLVPDGENLILSSSKARALWPNEFVHLKDWGSRVRVAFSHLMLSSLSYESSMSYLNRVYGHDWRTTVYQVWDHLKDEPIERKDYVLPHYNHAPHSKYVR